MIFTPLDSDGSPPGTFGLEIERDSWRADLRVSAARIQEPRPIENERG
jgi:hypothetical protein